MAERKCDHYNKLRFQISTLRAQTQAKPELSQPYIAHTGHLTRYMCYQILADQIRRCISRQGAFAQAIEGAGHRAVGQTLVSSETRMVARRRGVGDQSIYGSSDDPQFPFRHGKPLCHAGLPPLLRS